MAKAQEVQALFAESLAEMKAAQNPADKAFILAWPNGLCVGFAKEGNKPFACHFPNAEVIGSPEMPEEAWASVPNVFNGAGEQAAVISRQAYLVRQIAHIESLLASA